MQRIENDCTPVGCGEIAAMLRSQNAAIGRMREALRQVAQAHAWLAFGECRSFGADVPLLTPREADALARVALGECCEGRGGCQY